MEPIAFRQPEAWEFISSIDDPTEKLLVHSAMAHAISFLIKSEEYRDHILANMTQRMDLYFFVRAVDAFLKRQPILRDILDGTITGMDDLGFVYKE